MNHLHTVYLTTYQLDVLASGLALLAESDPREVVSASQASSRTWGAVFRNPYGPEEMGPLATMLAELQMNGPQP